MKKGIWICVLGESEQKGIFILGESVMGIDLRALGRIAVREFVRSVVGCEKCVLGRAKINELRVMKGMC